MRRYPSLQEIAAAIEALRLLRCKKAPQGRKPQYSDEPIIAPAVDAQLWRVGYAQDLPGTSGSCTLYLTSFCLNTAGPQYPP